MTAYREFACFYDRLMEDMPYREWIEFAEEAWNRSDAPRRVADLGCGTGNIAIPLAMKGYQMTGIDISDSMLAVARDKEQHMLGPGRPANTRPVEWIAQDIREWGLGRPVDAAISFCDSLNYLLEEEDLQSAFDCTFAALKDGGTFVFDMQSPLQFKLYAERQPFVLDEEDLAYIWTVELDSDRYEIEHALTIFAGEPTMSEASGFSKPANAANRFRRIEEFHRQRAYPKETVLRLLRNSGFHVADCYADFAWEPANDESLRYFFVAFKQRS